MKIYQSKLIYHVAAIAVLFSGAPVVAAVKVDFPQPEKYSDVPFTHHGKEAMMTTLRRHFEKLGATLPAGQNLNIVVEDILALDAWNPILVALSSSLLLSSLWRHALFWTILLIRQ